MFQPDQIVDAATYWRLQGRKEIGLLIFLGLIATYVWVLIIESIVSGIFEERKSHGSLMFSRWRVDDGGNILFTGNYGYQIKRTDKNET